MSAKRATGLAAAGILLGSVIAANWLTTRFGFVSVGFGFTATAGTFAAGFALAARDATQDLLGRKAMLTALMAGAAISYVIADPMIALASAAAFLLSELLNFAVYTPIREGSRLGGKRWVVAVGASSAAGAVADTVVFLAIAFGWAAVLPALAGQIVGKAWATLGYLVIGKATSVALLRQPDRITEGA